MAVEIAEPSRWPHYVDIDGIRMNKRFSPAVVRSAIKYAARGDDTFLLSYPKCGTHWTQQIAYLIAHKGVPPTDVLRLHMHSPSLEKFGAGTITSLPNRGLIRTHLPYDLVPKHPEAKYLYVCRNPKDVCVSFFYHTKGLDGYDFADGKFEDFFEVFLEGDTDFGDYFRHVLPWYARRRELNVLFLNYEDMKADPRKQILKIAKFIDRERYEILRRNKTMLDDVVNRSSSEYMKNHASKDASVKSQASYLEDDVPESMRVVFEQPGAIRPMSGVVRTGRTGGWREHFTPEMNDRMEKKIVEEMSHTDLIALWKQYGILGSFDV